MEILPSGTTKLRVLIDSLQVNGSSDRESDINLSLLLSLLLSAIKKVRASGEGRYMDGNIAQSAKKY